MDNFIYEQYSKYPLRRVIRIRKLKKDRQHNHNGPKKKVQKDKQRSTKHYT